MNQRRTRKICIQPGASVLEGDANSFDVTRMSGENFQPAREVLSLRKAQGQRWRRLTDLCICDHLWGRAPSTETDGHADFEGGHVVLSDVLKDCMASDPLRGMAAAALADSPRLRRGMDTDLESAKDMYATALELGRRSAAYSLGLYWEGRWDKSVPCDVVPDSTKSAQAYKCGGSNPKCAARLDAFRARSRQITPIARADARKSELCVLAYALG